MLLQDKATRPAAATESVQVAAGASAAGPKIEVTNLDFYYGTNRVLQGINAKIPVNQVTALIGPSGCGKSTFLRTLNRMNDIIVGARVEGSVVIDGLDIYEPSV